MDEPSRFPEEQIEVVWPLGKSANPNLALQPRLDDLNGKTVAELWDNLFRGEDIFPAIRGALKEKYPGVRFVDYTHFGDVSGPQQHETIGNLAQRLRDYGCDAVITGIGA